MSGSRVLFLTDSTAQPLMLFLSTGRMLMRGLFVEGRRTALAAEPDIVSAMLAVRGGGDRVDRHAADRVDGRSY